MLLGTLGASLLGNILTAKGMLRAGYGSKMNLNNIEIQKYYPNKPRFNGVYSRDNLS